MRIPPFVTLFWVLLLAVVVLPRACDGGRGIDEHGMTPLMRAARSGDTLAIRGLLDRFRPFRPAVDDAVASDDFRDLLALLAWMRQRPERRDHWTALHFAVEANERPAARLLLEAGADPNLLTRGGATALDLAAGPTVAGGEGPPDMIRLLLDRGGRAGPRGRGATTPLDRSLAAGDTALLRRLVDAGYDPDGGRTEATPLMIAASAGDAVQVEALLRVGADPSRRDGRGWTAGMIALGAGHSEVARLLGAAGTPDGAAVRAIERVAADDAEGLEALLSEGPLPDARDARERSLLQLAADTAGEAVLAVLLDAGAALPTGHPLDVLMNKLIFRGFETTLERILATGAPLSADAASWAVLNGDAELLRRMLALGAPPDEGANRPLFYAIREADPVLMEILLEAGADPREPLHTGAVPLEMAEMLAVGCAPCARVLQEHAETGPREVSGPAPSAPPAAPPPPAPSGGGPR